jgi:hypothetical protein
MSSLSRSRHSPVASPYGVSPRKLPGGAVLADHHGGVAAGGHAAAERGGVGPDDLRVVPEGPEVALRDGRAEVVLAALAGPVGGGAHAAQAAAAAGQVLSQAAEAGDVGAVGVAAVLEPAVVGGGQVVGPVLRVVGDAVVPLERVEAHAVPPDVVRLGGARERGRLTLREGAVVHVVAFCRDTPIGAWTLVGGRVVAATTAAAHGGWQEREPEARERRCRREGEWGSTAHGCSVTSGAHGQPLLLLLRDERREEHHAAAVGAQLPGAGHALPALRAAHRRALRRGQDHLPHRAPGGRARVRARRGSLRHRAQTTWRSSRCTACWWTRRSS